MTNMKKTKRALMSSVVSLILCFSMLLGTTYAWFTDSVTSKNNIITAGNLDVELYYQTEEVTQWTKVDETTNVFQENVLWEPGHTEVVKFKIVNEGSLALKYQLSVNVVNEIGSKNVAGEDFKLSDYIDFGVVEGANDYTSRDEAIAAVKATNKVTHLSKPFSTEKISLPVDDGTTTETKENEAYVTMVVYMPTDVDNKANHAKNEPVPTIELGINLVATQVEAESDAFGNDYDEPAPMPVVSAPAPIDENNVTNIELVAGKSNETKVDLPAGAVQAIIDTDSNITSVAIQHSAPKFDTNKVTFESFELVDQNGKVIDLQGAGNDKAITVTLNVGDAFNEGDVILVYHDDELVGEATVTADETIVYTTTHFCEIVVATNDGTLDSALELDVAFRNGGEITLDGDITLTESLVIPEGKEVVLNLNGKTINAGFQTDSTDRHIYAIDNYGSLVINGGTIEARGIYNHEDATLTVNETKIVNLDMNGGSCIWSYGGEVYINNATLIGYTGCVYSEGYLEINGGTYTCYSAVTDDGEQISPTYNIRSTGELVINGGDFTSRHGLLAIKGSAEINGGTYTMTSIGVITSHVFYVHGDSSNVVVNDGTFNCDLRTAQNNGSSMICVNAADVTVNVYGGTFNLTPAKYVADGCKVTNNSDGTYTVEFDGVKVSTADELVQALEEGENVIFVNDIKIDPANMSNAYGTTGINVKNGQIIDGNGYTLDIKGAGGTWDSGINTTGGLIRNLKVTGSFRGIFINHNSTYSEKVVLENVIIEGTTYTISCDQGLNQGLEAINCTFKGWTSYAGTLGDAKFVNCYFGEGSGYAYCRPYAPTTFVGCEFEAGFEMDSRAEVTFENCTIGDEALTAYNVRTLVTSNAANIESVDGVEHTYVTSSDDLNKAIAEGKTFIDLDSGEYIADLYNIDARDTLIITGQGADTKLAFANLQVRASQFKELTINNCTIERMPNKGWGHLVYSSSDNADGVYTISNCIFNGVVSQGIFINENVSGATYNIVDCVFNGDFGSEGAITIQNNADVNVNVNVNGCTFNNIPETSNGIFVHYENKGLNLTVDGKVTVANATMLADAVSKGATEIYLMDGSYTMPDGSDINLQNKTLKITGSRNAVIDVSAVDARDQFVTGATIEFDGVTLNFGKVNYMGFANTASLTYKNCQINGLQFLYGEKVSFENCDLNSNGAEHCVWTYGVKNVSFTDCDFTYGDRGINCYSDNDVTGGKQTVTFTDCTFATENTASEGAVEINSCFFSVGIEVNMNGCTAPAYGEMAYVSPWDSTNGAKTTINIK